MNAMVIDTGINKRKWEENNVNIESKRSRFEHQNKNENRHKLLINLPNEVLDIIIKQGNLSNKDIINISVTNSEHRMKYFSKIYESIRMKWDEVKKFEENFKQKELVEQIRIFSDLNNKKITNFGEWNVSIKKILIECPNLKSFVIELLTSGRSLKYKDDFDIDLSNKIESLYLISHSHNLTSGEANDESLFELTQLQRFHNIKKLKLNGFSISKDLYFYPKLKEDMSDYKIRVSDGKLNNLQEISLINCQWEHPINLKEVFQPEYPIPVSIIKNDTKMATPSKISLFYSNDFSKFVVSERFKSLVDNDYNKFFLFEIEFYKNLKSLEIVILNENYEDNKFQCYYPWLNLLNLRREFYVENGDEQDGIQKQCILSNLEELKLIGWRVNSVLELDKCFRVAEKGLKLKMKNFELYIMRTGNYDVNNITEDDRNKLDEYERRLDMIMNGGRIGSSGSGSGSSGSSGSGSVNSNGNDNDDGGDNDKRNKNSRCRVKVGYVEECFNDGRYNDVFKKV